MDTGNYFMTFGKGFKKSPVCHRRKTIGMAEMQYLTFSTKVDVLMIFQHR
jgi:hypothetical protein